MTDVPGSKRLDALGAGIYFLTLGGLVVYIGRSKSVVVRVLAHRARRDIVFDDAFYVLAQPGDDLVMLERRWIAHFDPPENRIHRASGEKRKGTRRELRIARRNAL